MARFSEEEYERMPEHVREHYKKREKVIEAKADEWKCSYELAEYLLCREEEADRG